MRGGGFVSGLVVGSGLLLCFMWDVFARAVRVEGVVKLAFCLLRADVLTRGRMNWLVHHGATTNLLLMNLERVAVLHVELSRSGQHGGSAWEGKCRDTYTLGGVVGLDSGAVEEETDTGGTFALTVTERIHELLQLGRSLDLEEDLVVVVGHLDVEVFGLPTFRLGGGGVRISVVRHFIELCSEVVERAKVFYVW